MKQTVELEVPEGYEVDMVIGAILIDGDKSFQVKLKKKPKDFSWYIDEYLHTYPTTNNEIVNWLEDDQVSLMRDRLKAKQFSLVPWEIKIGLFKFICDDLKINLADPLYDIQLRRAVLNQNIFGFIPVEFINSLK